MRKLLFVVIAFFTLNTNAQQGTQYVPTDPLNTRLNVTVGGVNRWVLVKDLVKLTENINYVYQVQKVGSLTIATPLTNSGLPAYSGSDSYTVIQNAIDQVRTLPLMGGIAFGSGTFTLSNELTITGKDSAFDPRSQISLVGAGYSTVFEQNTSGKNAFVFKNKISAIVKGMAINVGVLGKSGILGEDNGSSPGFGEISVYEAIFENIKINHSGTGAAFHLKNSFNVLGNHIDAISTTNHGILLQGTSVSGQNYGNSTWVFTHANGGPGVGYAGLAMISDVPSHPLNFNVFVGLYIGSGYYGLYGRGASSNTIVMLDGEYMSRNVKFEGGAAGVESGNNKILSGYIYTNPGGTALDFAEKTSGNSVTAYIQCDDATPTIINDLQQFRAGNEYDLIVGFSGGANPIRNITSPLTTKLTIKKEFDGLVIMAGPYVIPDLTAVAQNVKPSTGNTRDLGDNSNFWANIYGQTLRGNFMISRSADLALSTNASGSGIEFSLNNTATKVGKFVATTGNFILGSTFTDNGSRFQTTSFSAANTAAKTANYTILVSDYTVKGNTTSGAFNITLPTAVSKTGQIFIIKQIGTANTLTVNTTSSQTIDGATTYSLTTQYSFVVVQSNGATWDIIGKG